MIGRQRASALRSELHDATNDDKSRKMLEQNVENVEDVEEGGRVRGTRPNTGQRWLLNLPTWFNAP